MEFILNKNKHDLEFDERDFVWEFDRKDEVSYNEVVERINKGTQFDVLTVTNPEESPIYVDLENGTWNFGVLITIMRDTSHFTSKKYFFQVSTYAEEIYGKYDMEFDESGPLLVDGKYVAADSEKEAFEMLGYVMDVLLSNLENYNPKE